MLLDIYGIHLSFDMQAVQHTLIEKSRTKIALKVKQHASILIMLILTKKCVKSQKYYYWVLIHTHLTLFPFLQFPEGGGGWRHSTSTPPPPLDIACVTSSALRKIEKHPYSCTFASTPPPPWTLPVWRHPHSKGGGDRVAIIVNLVIF